MTDELPRCRLCLVPALSGGSPSVEADGYPVKPAGRWMDDLDGSELASSGF